MPAGGGAITQWQTLTNGDTPGASMTLVVIRPQGSAGSGYTVVGVDPETIPNPLPLSGVASYTVAHPIVVQRGDTLGLSSPGGVGCYFGGGMTPYFDSVVLLSDPTPPPSPGQSLTLVDASGNGAMLNVAATLSQAEDTGVTASAGPLGAAAGRPALLGSTVSNAGPSSGPITFADHVPNGLRIDSASAGSGSCSAQRAAGDLLDGVASGQSVPVNIVVTPTAAGSNYANSVSVAVRSPFSDSNSANNAASVALAVGPPAPNPRCVVPKLKGTPFAVARTVLQDLGCKVKLKHKHSSVPKGDVIGTSPAPGTYAYQTTVTLRVSSGKKH